MQSVARSANAELIDTGGFSTGVALAQLRSATMVRLFPSPPMWRLRARSKESLNKSLALARAVL